MLQSKALNMGWNSLYVMFAGEKMLEAFDSKIDFKYEECLKELLVKDFLFEEALQEFQGYREL